MVCHPGLHATHASPAPVAAALPLLFGELLIRRPLAILLATIDESMMDDYIAGPMAAVVMAASLSPSPSFLSPLVGLSVEGAGGDGADAGTDTGAKPRTGAGEEDY